MILATFDTNVLVSSLLSRRDDSRNDGESVVVFCCSNGKNVANAMKFPLTCSFSCFFSTFVF